MSYRLDPKDVLQIRVRNSSLNTVPIGSFTSVRDATGLYRVLRYNLYPAAEARRHSGPRLLAGPGRPNDAATRRRDAARRFDL